ncbi:MAG: GNAT family N-acetyltransferase [Hyphomicrobiales bacterium]|nr:GNAT family N-acetyltransferase [Hyphomicrobiales bacterium]
MVQAFRCSYCIGLFKSEEQIGFARAVSDGYTCAYVADFFIFEAHQRQGNGQKLWEGLCNHPDLSSVRRWYLGTKDAHGFYEKLGFQHSPDGIYMHFKRL